MLNLQNTSVFKSLNSPDSHKPIMWPHQMTTPSEEESASQRLSDLRAKVTHPVLLQKGY